MTKLAALILLTALNSFAAKPSAVSCDYYSDLNVRMKCGPDSYLAEGDSLCRQYMRMEPRMTVATQVFFPKVRLCLQQELEAKNVKARLTCDNLNWAALSTHIHCYKKTGYCDLPKASKKELENLMMPRLREKWLWDLTAAGIIGACETRLHRN